MNEHNFVALTTFRGWSEEHECFLFGGIYINKKGVCFIMHETGVAMIVHPDSIGVYTGKDDKYCTPIFCGVSGAEFGGDKVELEFISGLNEVQLSRGVVTYYAEQASFYSKRYEEEIKTKNSTTITKVGRWDSLNHHLIRVLSTQWEEHLKANQ